MKRLKNWSVVFGSNLHGIVFGHPKFENGTEITTSKIVGTREGLILTYSGSEYQLEDVDPEYEKAFPNARQRLLKAAEKL